MSYQSVQHAIATKQNIELIRKFIQVGQKRVVDIGCNEGIVSMSLAMAGYDVHGIEANKQFADSAERRSKQPLKYGSMKVTQTPLTFENLSMLDDAETILLLSVHHQFVAHLGLDHGNKLLIEIFKRAKRQFFFQPATIFKKYKRSMPFIENDFSSIEDYFVKLLLNSRDAKYRFLGLTDNQLPASEPLRPLMLFEFEESNHHYYRMPSCPETLKIHKSDVVQITIEKAVSNYWFRFDENGDHPMKLQFAQLAKEKGQLNIEETILFNHYKNFQPQTYADAALYRYQENLPVPLGDFSTKKYLSLKGATSDEPSTNWNEQLLNAKEIPEWDQNLIGPQSNQKIVSELERLSSIYKSLLKNGYSPDLFEDGFIRGYFLTWKDEWAFKISAGMHRLAVMSFLGYQNFRVKLQPNQKSIVDCEDSKLPIDLQAYLKLHFRR